MSFVIDLVGQVEAVVSDRQLFRKGRGVLLAVSGGLDSMVLLDLMNSLAERWRWRLTVAHFNHRLRGRASGADARLVRRSAEKLGLDFVSESGDVASAAKRKGVSIEMAAREVRHDFLARVARRRRTRSIALAHHADDQVELFLMRMLRGSGSEGLAGMRWRSPSPADARVELIRPLLGCRKAELAAFASERGIDFREDASNATLDHQRNRIRHELLPLLERDYQPGMRGAILRAIEILGEEGCYVRAKAGEWLQAADREPFSSLPVAIQRRSLQAWLSAEGIAADFELIERLRLNPGERVSLNRGLFVARQGDGLVFSRELDEAKVFSGRGMAIELNGTAGTAQFGGLTVRWHKGGFSWPASFRTRNGWSREDFDAEKVGVRIKLRHWQAGDRFRPIGMKQEIKLQDWFTNLKVPRDQRHQLVVAEAEDGRLFWVEGLRIAEGFKLDKATTHRLKWEWRRHLPPTLPPGGNHASLRRF